VQTIMLESGAVALEGGADALGHLQRLLQSDLRVALSPRSRATGPAARWLNPTAYRWPAAQRDVDTVRPELVRLLLGQMLPSPRGF